MERTLALRSYELRVENIVVDCKLDRNLPQTLADPYQLQQVVLNLVINAEQALLEGRGEGHIRIRTSRMTPRAGDLTKRRIVIEISGHGPGIRANCLPSLRSFLHYEARGSGDWTGTLHCLWNIHQHGGEVTFENQPGGGVKFTVELPVVAVSSQARHTGAGPSGGRSATVALGAS